jgi:muconate cycloisomerase
MKDNITVDPPEYCDFQLAVPAGPGFGVTIDEDKVAFYRNDTTGPPRVKGS